MSAGAVARTGHIEDGARRLAQTLNEAGHAGDVDVEMPPDMWASVIAARMDYFRYTLAAPSPIEPWRITEGAVTVVLRPPAEWVKMAADALAAEALETARGAR